MTSMRAWDEADALLESGGRRRPEVTALPPDRPPTVAELFTFMRDAELRFETLRMQIEERTATARGELVVVSEVLLRHPGQARVTTTRPERGPIGHYELWLSDGEIVRTYSAEHRLGTERPARPSIRGLQGREGSDLPGRSRVYVPLTTLPARTLPDAFIHPAGYCQNVLSTGPCRIVGDDTVGDRQAVVLECAHPRTTEVTADRPDFRIRLAVDRADGVILRLTEWIGGHVTRDAVVVEYRPDSPLVPSAFAFTFPSDARRLY